MNRVLVVDDDPQLTRALRVTLRASGYEVVTAADGRTALREAATERPDLVVLDLGLPDLDGIEVLAGLRPWFVGPVLVLSARADSRDKVGALDAGADDYVTKPFAMAELLARLRALLRRTGRMDNAVWAVGDLVVDEAAHRARRGDAELVLTKVEFDLLVALGRNAGRVLSKGQLLADVWGFADYDPNVVEVAMSGLRRKLENHGPRLVQTVRGVGYVMRV